MTSFNDPPPQAHLIRTAIFVFLAFLALYSANGRTITEVDCLAAPYAAWALVQNGSFDVAEYPRMQELERRGALHRLENGQLLSKYPPGSSLSALPLIAPLALWMNPPKPSRVERIGKFVASVYVAAAVALLYLMVIQIAPTAAAPAVIVAGAGSSLWSTASQGLWAHGPATFFLVLSFWLLFRNINRINLRFGFWAGLAMGMAIINRPTVILFCFATLAALLFLRRIRIFSGVLIGLAGPGLLLATYNFYYFQNFVSGGYLEEASLWTTPAAIGLAGLLIAPSRGLLIYSPAFVIAPFSLLPNGHRSSPATERRTLAIAWLIASGATLLLYAKWHVWWGGWSFGPRFATEAVPALTLGLALGWERLAQNQNGKMILTLWSLVFISVAIHFIGVFGYHTAWMNENSGGADMFSIRDTQIAARFTYLIANRPASFFIPLAALCGWLVWYRRRGQSGSGKASPKKPRPTIR